MSTILFDAFEIAGAALAAIAAAAALELGAGDLVQYSEPGMSDTRCMRVASTLDYAGQPYAWLVDVESPGRAVRAPIADLRRGCKP